MRGRVAGLLLLVMVVSGCGADSSPPNAGLSSTNPSNAGTAAAPKASPIPVPVPFTQAVPKPGDALAEVVAAAAKADAAGTVKFSSSSVMRDDDDEVSWTLKTYGISSLTLPTTAAYTRVQSIPAGKVTTTRVILAPPTLSLSPPPFDSGDLAARAWVTAAIEDPNRPLGRADDYAAERTRLKLFAALAKDGLPSYLLKCLSVASEAVEVDSARISGAETRHFIATVGDRDIFGAYGGRLVGQYAYGQPIPDPGAGKIQIEVWIAMDGFARQIRLIHDNASMAATHDLLDYGVALDVRPPPAEQTTDLRVLLAAAPV